MAHYGNNDRYADPYQQNQYASYDQTPYGYSHDAPQHQQYGYASNETPNYSTPDVQHGQHQQQQPDYYTSTDKINENSAAVGAGAEDYSVPVERERKGRQNVGGNSKSWAQGPPPRSTGILRMWRKDERGKQWTRGGGCRFAMRLCCCCLTLGIIIALSIILTIALYLRPPSVVLNNINVGNNAVSLSPSGLSIAFTVGLSVTNPNWFSVNFRQIKASVSYPGVQNSDLGGGQLDNVNFAGYTQSTFNFPLSFNYTLASDPNRVIINDLASKCGPGGSDININYKLDLDLRVLGVSVKPTFSDRANFECPISSDQIQGIIGGALGS